jgi:protein SCO1/2
MTLRLLRITLFALLGIVVAGLFAWQYGWLSPGGSRGGASGVASIGGPFTLVDQTGATRTDADFRGKLMLIYFGYTWCPDVCPTAVQVMSVALDMLGEQGKEVVPILITVDPARDTPSHLAEYVGNFHPRLVGLTGSPEAIRETAKAYRVYYRKAEINAEGEKTGDEDYLMDHSSVVYLMDRDGRYLTHFTHQSQSEDIAAGIRKHL